MNTYCIENDGFKFQELDLEIEEFIDKFPDHICTIELYDFSKNNIALGDYWGAFQTGFSPIEGRENLIPDIALWIEASLVLSPKAHRLLGDLLKDFGELLPFFIEGETYYIFNCLTMLHTEDNIVADKSAAIFKVESELGMKIYCSSSVKETIEAFELKGIVFVN